MNLEEFVRDVIVGIDKGVDSARDKTNRNVYLSTPSGSRTVEFDVAVSVENTDTANGKAGVRVLNFAEAGGDIGSEKKNSTVSRVKFGLNIEALTKDEAAERRREIERLNNQPISTDSYY